MVAGVSSARTRRPRRDCRRISRPRTHHHPSSGLPTRPTTSCTLATSRRDASDYVTGVVASILTWHRSSDFLVSTRRRQPTHHPPSCCSSSRPTRPTSTRHARDRHARRHADDEPECKSRHLGRPLSISPSWSASVFQSSVPFNMLHRPDQQDVRP